MPLFYSFIIPVFNRPKEVQELLASFTQLNTAGLTYEILIVEDGSAHTAKEVVDKFKQLPLKYFYKENTGPGDSRNFGMRQASGNYFIILDSDVLIPPDYLKNVADFLHQNYVDCYGGADAAHQNFTPVQKAINFSMTSFFTTGGIRGKENSVENFKPRSFNMGISKKAFLATQGYAKMRVGEDLDLSIRIEQKGFKTAFIAKATVYHKRRNTWSQFYKQVSTFGLGRPVLNKWYPKTTSLVFWFPSLFFIGLFIAVIFAFLQIYALLGFYILYFLLIFVSSAFENKNFKVGIYSVWAVLIQFCGYGLGYLKSSFYINVCGKKPHEAFPKLFFE